MYEKIIRIVNKIVNQETLIMYYVTFFESQALSHDVREGIRIQACLHTCVTSQPDFIKAGPLRRSYKIYILFLLSNVHLQIIVSVGYQFFGNSIYITTQNNFNSSHIVGQSYKSKFLDVDATGWYDVTNVTMSLVHNYPVVKMEIAWIYVARCVSKADKINCNSQYWKRWKMWKIVKSYWICKALNSIPRFCRTCDQFAHFQHPQRSIIRQKPLCHSQF